MALPIIPQKQFEVKSKFLPKGKITLVPFCVGQQQHLIQIKDSEDESEKMLVLKQVIQECVKTPNVDVSKLPLFIIEDLFLQLLQNSTGELIPLAYQCKNTVDGVVCDNSIELEIDIREFNVKESEDHVTTIMIAPPIGIKFKYPSIEMYENSEGDMKDDMQVILACIDMIIDGDNVFPAADHTKEELEQFWNQQTLAQKKLVYDKFFDTIPHMYYKKVVKCKKCGHEHPIEFNSMLEVFS